MSEEDVADGSLNVDGSERSDTCGGSLEGIREDDCQWEYGAFLSCWESNWSREVSVDCDIIVPVQSSIGGSETASLESSPSEGSRINIFARRSCGRRLSPESAWIIASGCSQSSSEVDGGRKWIRNDTIDGELIGSDGEAN